MSSRWLLADAVLWNGQLLRGTAVEVSADGILLSAGAFPQGATVERLPGRLLLPGFVNVHSHAFQRLLRGRTQARSPDVEVDDFWTWREAMYRAAMTLDPDGLYVASRQCFLEMALAGMTSVGEFHYLHHQPDGTPYAEPLELALQVIRAARDVGLRIVLLRTGYNRAGYKAPPNPRQRRFYDATPEAWLRAAEDLRARTAEDTLVTVGIAPHSVRAVPRSWLEAAAAAKQSLVHMHVAEQPEEVVVCEAEYGRRPVELLADVGLLREGFTAVHAVYTMPHERELLRGTSVCACPSTERDLGDGVLAADGMARAGVRLCVGTDSQATLDVFDELRMLEGHLRLTRGRRAVLDAPEGPDGLGQLLLGFAIRKWGPRPWATHRGVAAWGPGGHVHRQPVAPKPRRCAGQRTAGFRRLRCRGGGGARRGGAGAVGGTRWTAPAAGKQHPGVWRLVPEGFSGVTDVEAQLEATLRALVSFDTTSRLSNVPLVDWLLPRLTDLGFSCQRHPYRDDAGVEKQNLLALPPGGGLPELALVGHTDCVPYDSAWADALHLTARDGNLYGRGACDTKAFLACALVAAERTGAAKLAKPAALFFTADEEVGCVGAKMLVEEKQGRARRAIVGEPTSLTPVRANKGYCLAEVTVKGKEGHSAYPASGISAINGAARLISRIEDYAKTELQKDRDEAFEPPYTTLSVGLIQGGRAKNVISGQCTFTLEWRPLPRQSPDVVPESVKRLARDVEKATPGLHVEVRVQRTDRGVETPASAGVVAFLAKETGRPPITVSFGTEAPQMTALGAEAVVFGPGNIRVAHQSGEFVPVAELLQCEEILEKALRHFCT